MLKKIVYGLISAVTWGALLAAPQTEPADRADSLMKVGIEQVPVALTPMTVFPWLPVSTEYVSERLTPFLSEQEKVLFEKALGVLRVPVKAYMYQGVVDTCDALFSTVKMLNLKGIERKKRMIALIALKTLRDDIKSAIKVLNNRQRLFLQGKDAFASVDYRKARVEREKTFASAGRAVTVAAVLASIAATVGIGSMLLNSYRRHL